MGEEEKKSQEQRAEEAMPEAAPAGGLSDEEFNEFLSEKFGKFDDLAKLLKKFKTPDSGDLIPGIEFLNPGKANQRKDFLQNKDFAKQRKLLAERLRLWKEALSQTDDPDEMRKILNEKMTQLEANLEKNMKKVLAASRDMETVYRAIDKFFANAQQEPDEKVNAWFVNVSAEELLDPDDKEKFEELGKAISGLYREFSIKNCFSLAVIPGWLGSVENIDTVARQLGMPNKVQVFTDLPDCESFDDVMDMLENPVYENLSGIDEFKQYVTVYANYIMAREANDYEDDEMWIPPSAAVAGKVYQGDTTFGIQQPAAGFKSGKIAEAKNLRFRSNQVESDKIYKKNVNPMTSVEGSVVAMGDQTCSTKETFNVYSIRRTYDYVYKTLRNYLNKQVFQVIDAKFIKTLNDDIHKFMRSITGADNILTDYEVTVFADEEMRKRQEVDVKISLNPKYPVRAFNIEFTAWGEDNQTKVKDKE